MQLREGIGVSISQTIQAPLGFLFAMIRPRPALPLGPNSTRGIQRQRDRRQTRVTGHAAVLCYSTLGAVRTHGGLGGRALMRGWKLSLAMMAVLPLIVVSMGILATVMKSSGEVP